MQKVHIIQLYHIMIGHEVYIAFHQKRDTRLALFSCYWHLKRSPPKIIVYAMIFEKNLYIQHYARYYTGMFPHSYA